MWWDVYYFFQTFSLLFFSNFLSNKLSTGWRYLVLPYFKYLGVTYRCSSWEWTTGEWLQPPVCKNLYNMYVYVYETLKNSYIAFLMPWKSKYTFGWVFFHQVCIICEIIRKIGWANSAQLNRIIKLCTHLIILFPDSWNWDLFRIMLKFCPTAGILVNNHLIQNKANIVESKRSYLNIKKICRQ